MATTSPSEKYSIRTANEAEVPFLADIERSAGQLFRTVGLDSVADDEPMPPEVLSSYLEAGNLWVAVASKSATRSGEGEEDGEVVAFLGAFSIIVTGSSTASSLHPPQHPTDHQKQSQREEREGSERQQILMHIAELSVHASHHRRGVGKRLLQHFEDTITSRSRTSTHRRTLGLSLTTYIDLPFNGPFYARFGFEEVPGEKIGEVVGTRGMELWKEEQGRVAMPERRCWMVKWLQ